MMSLKDRYIGSMIGLAVGDAMGVAVEFRPPGTFEPVREMTGGGVFRLKPGEWTDDTSMAICLAESLIACRGFSPKDQMDRYVRWYKEGYNSSTGQCFDIGNTVRDALERYLETGQPFSGSEHPDSAGNGSLMRLAPAALFYAENPDEAIRFCGLSSATTHGAMEAIDACKLMGALIIGCLRNVGKADLLKLRFLDAMDIFCPVFSPSIVDIMEGSYRRKQPPEIRASGYVARSLEAALWAFSETDTFEEGLLKAVNLGDDADTVGAIYGQLAGAYYGIQGIPARWVEPLAFRDKLFDLAEGLYLHRERAQLAQ